MLDLDYNKKIGIAVSGGADSAILTYLILKEAKKPVHIFTTGIQAKKNRNIFRAFAVVEKCKELTGNNNVVLHTSYSPEGSEKDLINFWMGRIRAGLIDVIVTGTTSLPSNDVMNNFNITNDDLAEIEKRNPLIMHNEWTLKNKIYNPYINKNKEFIYQLYTENNLLESLFPVTFSCESPDDVTKHCEHCLWCNERFWAFKRYE